LYSAIKWSRENKKVVPPIVFLPAITHGVWFIGGEQNLAYNALVPFFHSAQYLFIAWAMQLKDVTENAKANKLGVKTDKAFAFKKTFIWMSINCVIGALMFEAFPIIFPSAGADPMISIGIVIVGIQVHHFFVDGVIWKLKDQH